MTCREFADFLAGYLSGELSVEETALFERHMSRCPNCRAYLANYRKTIDVGRQAFADDDSELSADVPDDLVNAILASATPRRRRAPRGPRSRRSGS